MGVATYQPCPNYGYPQVWIDGLWPGDKCSETRNCFQIGRACKFVLEYRKKKT